MKSLVLILTLICMAVILALASPALAQTPVTQQPVGFLSPDRVSVSGGVGYGFYQGGDLTDQSFKREVNVVLTGAYSILPSVALTASSWYGVDNKGFKTYLALQFLLKKGGTSW